MLLCNSCNIYFILITSTILVSLHRGASKRHFVQTPHITDHRFLPHYFDVTDYSPNTGNWEYLADIFFRTVCGHCEVCSVWTNWLSIFMYLLYHFAQLSILRERLPLPHFWCTSAVRKKTFISSLTLRLYQHQHHYHNKETTRVLSPGHDQLPIVVEVVVVLLQLPPATPNVPVDG